MHDVVIVCRSCSLAFRIWALIFSGVSTVGGASEGILLMSVLVCWYVLSAFVIVCLIASEERKSWYSQILHLRSGLHASPVLCLGWGV
jgi:hypothetical protein